MSDSAKGPVAGFLFQFEKALLLLSELNNIADFITIEQYDDVSVHNEFGVIILTLQAKHSISPNGSTFEDTSYSLWRTLQIWVDKIIDGVFDKDTTFVCSTNKKIPTTSLLYKIMNLDIKDVNIQIKSLLADQESKLNALDPTIPGKGSSIKQTIKFIKYILKNSAEFEIIKNNIRINDEEDSKNNFFIRTHLLSDNTTQTQRDSIYHSFYGWLIESSKAKWMNSTAAIFNKKDFDNKLYQIQSNPTIVNAIFRTKKLLGSISEAQVNEKRKELFVKQIEDINRNQDAKTRKIRDAILDYIYSDIEISHIIAAGNYTKPDFDEFLDECLNKWQECADNHIIKEIYEYNDDEKNSLAITIFDTIMSEIDIKFKDGFSFNTANKYIKNGSFLQLSNIPKIGWHPEWEINT